MFAAASPNLAAMEFQILGNPDYGELTLGLAPGETITAESITVTERRTADDFTEEVRDLLEARYPRRFKAGQLAFHHCRCPQQA